MKSTALVVASGRSTLVLNMYTRAVLRTPVGISFHWHVWSSQSGLGCAGFALEAPEAEEACMDVQRAAQILQQHQCKKQPRSRDG